MKVSRTGRLLGWVAAPLLLPACGGGGSDSGDLGQLFGCVLSMGLACGTPVPPGPSGPWRPYSPQITAAPAGSGEISLTWQASIGADSYLVKRASKAEPYATVAEGLTGLTFTDSGLTNGNTYYYRMQAVNSVGYSPESNEAEALARDPAVSAPAGPSDLSAVATVSEIVLTWTPSTPVPLRYVIRFSDTAGGPYTTLASDVSGATYSLVPPVLGKTFYFKVAGINSGGEGSPSNEAVATVPPATPSGLDVRVGNGFVRVFWSAPFGAVSYSVRRTEGSAGPWVTIVSGLSSASYTDSGLTNGTTYSYQVSASNAGGASGYSFAMPATPRNVVTISCSYEHSVAMDEQGAVWAWGSNQSGQLGVSAPSSSGIPLNVPGVGNVASVVAGTTFTAALRSDGSVVSWGGGSSRLLAVQGLSDVEAIAAGTIGVALRRDGTVWTWQPGSSIPILQPGVSGVTAIEAGSDLVLALKSDGTVWGWGRNDYGQLGDGTFIQRLSPGPVLNLAGITQIAAGTFHGLACRNDGTVWAWGYNSAGALGDGTLEHRSIPVQVQNLQRPVALAAGVFQSLALLPGGEPLTWGHFQRSPAPVPNFPSARALSGGAHFTLLLLDDGTVWHAGRWSPPDQVPFR